MALPENQESGHWRDTVYQEGINENAIEKNQKLPWIRIAEKFFIGLCHAYISSGAEHFVKPVNFHSINKSQTIKRNPENWDVMIGIDRRFVVKFYAEFIKNCKFHFCKIQRLFPVKKSVVIGQSLGIVGAVAEFIAEEKCDFDSECECIKQVSRQNAHVFIVALYAEHQDFCHHTTVKKCVENDDKVHDLPHDVGVGISDSQFFVHYMLHMLLLLALADMRFSW